MKKKKHTQNERTDRERGRINTSGDEVAAEICPIDGQIDRSRRFDAKNTGGTSDRPFSRRRRRRRLDIIARGGIATTRASSRGGGNGDDDDVRRRREPTTPEGPDFRAGSSIEPAFVARGLLPRGNLYTFRISRAFHMRALCTHRRRLSASRMHTRCSTGARSTTDDDDEEEKKRTVTGREAGECALRKFDALDP